MNAPLLPTINACLNLLSFFFLLLAFIQILRKNIENHKRLMICAMVSSILFLVCYLYYHATSDPVTFKGPVFIRQFIYLPILISHIILAIFIVPLACTTLILGLMRMDEKHKKIARWTFPLWVYVSITGVIVYIMLYQLQF